MGQHQSIPENHFYIYNHTDIVGYVENAMNSLIFSPPDKSLFEHKEKPRWLRYINLPNGNRLSYFIIEPSVPIDHRNNKHDRSNQSNKPYILWSHGNAGYLTHIYPILLSIHREMQGKLGIICYDYEGYGYSDGNCSEKSCYNDLTCMISHVLNTLNIPKKNLYLLGQSLGTGVVVEFCYRHLWTNPIILISAFKSISRVKIDPTSLDIVLNVVIDCLDMFDTHHKLHELKCHVVMYHGLSDELIPAYHSIDMYNDLKDKISIELILLPNANHNDMLHHIGAEQLLHLIQLLHADR